MMAAMMMAMMMWVMAAVAGWRVMVVFFVASMAIESGRAPSGTRLRPTSYSLRAGSPAPGPENLEFTRPERAQPAPRVNGAVSPAPGDISLGDSELISGMPPW